MSLQQFKPRHATSKYVNHKNNCDVKILKYSPVANKKAATKKSIIDAKSLYSLFLNHLYKKTGIEKPPHIKMLKINITIAFVTVCTGTAFLQKYSYCLFIHMITCLLYFPGLFFFQLLFLLPCFSQFFKK